MDGPHLRLPFSPSVAAGVLSLCSVTRGCSVPGPLTRIAILNSYIDETLHAV